VTLEHLEGSWYGPATARLTADRIASYVSATTDDPDRWVDHAPPSIAGALLFGVAPSFLWSDDVGPFSTVLVHSDQSFRWHGPLELDSEIDVTATVTRVRVRGSMNFVTFDAVMTSRGAVLIESTSNFLMGAESGGEPPHAVVEPPVRDAGISDIGSRHAEGPIAKSASRVDLVRYAAASGDFNPVHYDHDAARNAGLPGIVVHGLLAMAWASQLPAAASKRPDPLVDMKARFRAAVLPAVQAGVRGSHGEGAAMSITVMADDTPAVTCQATIREPVTP
jgi:acyl dehydratase